MSEEEQTVESTEQVTNDQKESTTEKVIDLDDNVSQPVDQQLPEIKAKTVKELTDEERQIIINNAKAGIDTPNFEVKFFKNGNTRIVKKKAKPLSVAQKALQNQPVTQMPEAKVCLSNDQLLMEHIIELNAKFDKLYSKHKKLKKKYYNLRDDIYVDDNEAQEEEKPVTIKDNGENEKITNTEQQNVYTPPPRIQSSNWRSRVQFLY